MDSRELPHPSTEFKGDPILRFDGESLRTEMKFWTPKGTEDCVLIFERVRAHRHVAEPYCEAWQYEMAYDRVAVIADSEWAAAVEERAAVPMPVGEHFVVTLDSWGCLEVLAAGVHFESAGSWA